MGIAEMFAELDGYDRYEDELLAFASARADVGRSYYQRNRERLLAKANARYRQTHAPRVRLTPEERAARARANARAYYQRNRERVLARVSARYRATKEAA